jgi:hypothetical protein
MEAEGEELAEALKKEDQQSVRDRKRKWIQELTRKGLGVKEQWQGMRFIGQPFKPKRYARRDRNGKPVNMDLRAEATKEYLAKDQWGKKEEERGNPRREEFIRTTEKILEDSKGKIKDLTWNTKPPTLGEIKAILKKFKRGKAPGADGITTDLVKDLKEEGLEEIRKLIKKWWTKKEVPNTLTLARVVSLYKKRGPRKAGKLQTH